LKPIRLAIAQQTMHWTLEENVASIVRSLEHAARAGATLCVFPELALTGFHRQIASQATAAKTAPQVHAVARACATHHIAAALGAPTFDHAGLIFNSHLYIDALGATVGTISKIGLTPPEATFFAPGVARPIVLLAGLRCSSVICREIEDVELVCTQLPAGSVDLILWPGAIRPAIGSNESTAITAEACAREIARRCNAYVVQANWPNSLNYPEESEFAGQSIVIDPQGEELMRLPVSQAGIATFELGARVFDWQRER
jgi:omega-amidase